MRCVCGANRTGKFPIEVRVTFYFHVFSEQWRPLFFINLLMEFTRASLWESRARRLIYIMDEVFGDVAVASYRKMGRVYVFVCVLARSTFNYSESK